MSVRTVSSDAIHWYPSGALAVAEASELGLAPGEWPNTLEVDGTQFNRHWGDWNTSTVVYQDFSSGRKITVFDD